MITDEIVKKAVETFLQGTDYALQTLNIDKENNILVEIDRNGIVDIDFCAELNRYLVTTLGDKDDYSLEVGSVSLTEPFKSKIQYLKHLGHNIVVTDNDGHRHSGQLVSVDEDTFMLDAGETITFRYDEVKKTIYNL